MRVVKPLRAVALHAVAANKILVLIPDVPELGNVDAVGSAIRKVVFTPLKHGHDYPEALTE